MSVAENKVNVEKSLRVPVGQVFEAISQGKLLFNCSGDVTDFKNDFRVGGGYRIKFAANGSMNAGKYLEIIPLQKIVFTWGDEGADSLFPFSTVSIQLQAEGDHTRLKLQHDGFTTADQVKSHDGGWNSGLADLAAELETHRLRIVRNFKVPVEKLFETCSQAQVFYKPVADVTQATADFKVGGHFQAPNPNGGVQGTYREIEPNKKIQFTWVSGCDKAGKGVSATTSTVTLIFKEKPTGSSLEVLHEGLPSSESVDQHRQGWGMVTGGLLQGQQVFKS